MYDLPYRHTHARMYAGEISNVSGFGSLIVFTILNSLSQYLIPRVKTYPCTLTYPWLYQTLDET